MKDVKLYKILKIGIINEYSDFLEEVEVLRVVFDKKSKVLDIYFQSLTLFPYRLYKLIESDIKERFNMAKVNVFVTYHDRTLLLGELIQYINRFSIDYDIKGLKDVICCVENDVITLSIDEVELETVISQKENLVTYLKTCGIHEKVKIVKKEVSEKIDKIFEVKLDDFQKKEPVIQQIKYRKAKLEQYQQFSIQDLPKDNDIKEIKVEGIIFKQEIIETKNNKYILICYVKDEADAFIAKIFLDKLEEVDRLKLNKKYMFYGSYLFDAYSNERSFLFRHFEEMEEKSKIVDTADLKRVEFHVHSNKSEMDGINDVSDLIKHAFSMGHKGMAITDHMVVQAFPKAQSTVKKLLKENPDRTFKMVYGVEMNMVKNEVMIVDHPTQENLEEVEYCIFDIETTGLSSFYDHIIEFGAVIYKDGVVIETKQFFVQSPIRIPYKITSITNITDDMVEKGLPLQEAMDEILLLFKNRVLVAHNATFDVDFINETLKRLNKPILTNTVIDTLPLAKALLENQKRFNLGSLAKSLSVEYNRDVAHRADYDAEVLSYVFKKLLNSALSKGLYTLQDLQNLQSKELTLKQRKSHVNVLAKNQKGLKDIFKLVTISHTDTLDVAGKVNAKSSGEVVVAVPTIMKDTLDEYRNDLYVGACCLNSDVFELACNKGQEALEEAMRFYDYFEIQPLGNYQHLIQSNSIIDLDRLKMILKRIIDTAKKLNKIIFASGDVHYISKEEKILRDIYINTQGIGGVRHPLYVYNDTVRKSVVSPDQHYFTTNEMLDRFDWLENEVLIDELVIKTPNEFLDTFESVYPIHDKLYPPVIEGSNDKLKALCYETAYSTYGNPLPKIVEDRLKRELNAIIGSGYGVVYYISHLLVKKSNEDGYLVGSRGSVGSSFAATMAKITEVNPLEPHYICPNCKHSIWFSDGSVKSGYDLPDRHCPKCNHLMKGEGQSIPFETFLGFEGNKVPDIDLNFSGEYQEHAHNFTKTIFGEAYVYRAGTIGTVANKTAYGYIKGYCEEMGIYTMSNAQKERLAMGCEGVKRTTGQHPGGIIVIPDFMDVHDFTPVQYPANNPYSQWKTTHFDFHDIHDNVLKLDILGHVDPTAMRLLQNISGIDPTTIPMNDPETMAIFSTIETLKADERVYNEITGAVGLPEFGTKFVRGILELTKPTTFSQLVAISGLSHGTDVWNNNAKDLIESSLKLTLDDVIGCRDDIMTVLIQYGLMPKDAFTIMESVRKGKGLTPAWIELMKSNKVPDWYIESCQKIKYMFPKAHAVAYVIMAIRIAWFKVHYPHYYYVSYFSLRSDAYEIETMIKDIDKIKNRMMEIAMKRSNRLDPPTKKELDIYDTLEVCLEMVARGYRLSNIDLEKSLANQFLVDPENSFVIIPPFTILDGLGVNVANSIVEAREKMMFISKEDLMNRTLLSQTLLKKLDSLKCLDMLQESNQISLF